MDVNVMALREEIGSLTQLPSREQLEAYALRRRQLLEQSNQDQVPEENYWLNSILPTILSRFGWTEADERSQPTVFRDGMPGHLAYFFGRQEEKEKLTNWSLDDQKRVVEIVGSGGNGKTQLVNNWILELTNPGAKSKFKAIFCWCFYTFNDRAVVSYNDFLTKAIGFFENLTGRSELVPNANRIQYLINLVASDDYLIILDGVEALQTRPLKRAEETDEFDETRSPGVFKRRYSSMVEFLTAFVKNNQGKLLITSRQPLRELANHPSLTTIRLSGIDPASASRILKRLGVQGTDESRIQLARSVGFHPLTLGLFGYTLSWRFDGIPEAIPHLHYRDARSENEREFEDRNVIQSYMKWLRATPEMEILRLVGFFNKLMIPRDDLEYLVRRDEMSPAVNQFRQLAGEQSFENILDVLVQSGLLLESMEDSRDGTTEKIKVYDAHPLLRSYFRDQLTSLENGELWRTTQRLLFERYRQKVDGRAFKVRETETLYEAIGYACEAGMFDEAFDVYWQQIHHNEKPLCDPEWYIKPVWHARDRLGLYSADLSALGWFYERPWERLRSELRSNQDQENIIRYATAECLKVLGYSVDAGHPINSARGSFVSKSRLSHGQARFAAIMSGWECERRLIQGRFEDAKRAGDEALIFARDSGDKRQLLSKYGRLGDYFLQVGDWENANGQFAEVIRVHREILRSTNADPNTPIGGFTGYLLADFLLTSAEIFLAGWDINHQFLRNWRGQKQDVLEDLDRVISDAERIINERSPNESLSDRALHKFIFYRAKAIKNILGVEVPSHDVEQEVNQGLAELESVFDSYARGELPRLLIKRSKVLRRLKRMEISEVNGRDPLELAYHCLNRALDISQHGDMLLYEADIMIEQSKVFLYESRFPRGELLGDPPLENAFRACKDAETMIKKLNYRKRLPELNHLKAELEAQQKELR